jgi:hypothetical protein
MFIFFRLEHHQFSCDGSYIFDGSVSSVDLSAAFDLLRLWLLGALQVQALCIALL